MGLKEHAIEELRRTGLLDSTDEMQQVVNKQILDLVENFAGQGHSGFSAGYTLNILKRVLNWEPIAPIQDTPESWVSLEQYGDKDTLQHKNLGSVFKDIKTGECYEVGKIVLRNQYGHTYTNGMCRPVRFPYMPPEPVIVDVWERPQIQEQPPVEQTVTPVEEAVRTPEEVQAPSETETQPEEK